MCSTASVWWWKFIVREFMKNNVDKQKQEDQISLPVLNAGDGT